MKTTQEILNTIQDEGETIVNSLVVTNWDNHFYSVSSLTSFLDVTFDTLPELETFLNSEVAKTEMNNKPNWK